VAHKSKERGREKKNRELDNIISQFGLNNQKSVAAKKRFGRHLDEE